MDQPSVPDTREDLVFINSNMYDIMQIFTILLDKESEDDGIPLRISPSNYMQQMLLTTEERTAQLMKSGRSVEFESKSSVHLCTYFKTFPSIVIFQQYFPGKTYNVSLAVRNVTKVSHFLKMNCERNPWFTIEHRGASFSTKVAPGMAMVYNVKFCPEERCDYKYFAKFVTESETFTVPIIAIGPRPLLDFPDRIDVPQTGVKIPSSKSVLIRNIGDVPAVFTLVTQSPFLVEPVKGVLIEDETMQVTVTFQSAKKGDFRGNMLIKYESGEVIDLNLYGSAVNCNIRLDRGSIRIEDTFFGMSRSKLFTIYNRSDYIVNFQWVEYKDQKIDNTIKEKYKKIFGLIRNMETVRCVDLERYDICIPDAHQLVCQRIYADEIVNLKAESFPFDHPNFKICLMEGEIWPQSYVDITVVFEPDEIGEISATAYLETSGRENRIPLSFNGLCKGPVFKLNMLSGDIEYIFLCSVHNYEVVCANVGFIPGTLVYRPKPTDFGGKIEVEPLQLKLKPQEYKSFTLTFSSNHNGEFIERVDFVVKESLEVISLYIKGHIICPTLHFNKPSLDFGVTPLGFSSKQEVCLHNLSLVPVTFSIEVVNDGFQPAITHEDFARSTNKPSLAPYPREFSISPNEGVVAAHSFLKIKIIYTPNIIRTGQTAIKVDLWDSDSVPVTLPIYFCCRVATLVVKPGEIIIRFCFINYPYARSITVENKSDVEGYYYFAPQSVGANTTMIYSLSSHQGYLKPNQSKSISLTIITTALGRQKMNLSFLTFGERGPTTACILICNGQGPVVSVQPMQLNWGEVQLLQDMTSILTIISDSPIPAQFTAALHKKHSPWTVSPTSGKLEANRSVELEVKIHLVDNGKYFDRVQIPIMNSRTISVPMTAIGIGTSIAFHPSMVPVFDMGILFSHQNINLPMMMENMGTHHHQLIWSPTPELQLLQKGVIQVPVYEKFRVEPFIVELPPGATTLVHCKIRWDVNETVTEQWYLHGLIQGQGKREVLATSLFTATFIEPDISFSKYELLFRFDMVPTGAKMKLTEELFALNKSRLGLTARMVIDVPFQIVTDNDEYVQKASKVLETNVQTRILLHFDFQPNTATNLYSRVYRGFLKFEFEEHPTKVKIKCRAEVNYPNVTMMPTKLVLESQLGCTAEKQVTLMNSGPIHVYYQFKWIEETIAISYTLPAIESEEMSEVTRLEEPSTPTTYSEQCESETEEPSPEYLGETMSEILEIPAVSMPLLSSPASTLSTIQKGTEKLSNQKNRPQSLTKIVSATKSFSALNMKSPEETVIDVTMDEVKDYIFPIIEKYFVEDSEIPVLEDMPLVPSCAEPMWDVLNIVPWEGLLLPYTSEYINFAFHGFQPMQIEATVVCEVKDGPSEIIKVKAVSDSIHYSLNKNVIDYGRQVFCEVCNTTLTLSNRGLVRFTYKTDTSDSPLGATTEQAEVSHLRVLPNCGVVEAMTDVQLEINFYSGIPGPIHEQFQLEIGYLTPITVLVEGLGAFPQVYLSVPRGDMFAVLPIELGYQAVNTLTTRFLIEVQGLSFPVGKFRSCGDDTPIPKLEKKLLLSDGWDVVSYGETVPSVMDIELAIERLLATNFIRENVYVLVKHNMAHKKKGIPFLFVPEYIIDMGFVVIGQAVHYSAMLFNYGPTRAEVRMKKIDKNDPLKRSGIIIQFRDQTKLPVGEYTTLHILFHPSRSRYPKRRMDIEFKFYIEVTHGCTLPVVIKATVTYPFLTAHTKLLEFNDVAIGQCKLMPLLLTNEGLVPCEWEAEIVKKERSRHKQDDGPFYLHYKTDIFPQGYENVVNVYFKPKKSYYLENKLKIKVIDGFEPLTIVLTGNGMDQRLNIVEPSITFPPVLPYPQLVEQTFTIENLGLYPLEFYWQHIDDEFLEEDRWIRVLAHYYDVDEILLPPRYHGESLAPQISEFYQDLIREVAFKLEARRIAEEQLYNATLQSEMMAGVVDEAAEEESNPETRERKSSNIAELKPEINRRRSSRRGSRRKSSISEAEKKLCKSLRGLSDLDLSGPVPALPTQDPDEIETLVHCYIDDLHQKENFVATMKDPVKDVLDAAEPKPPPIDPSLPKNRVCIIFHGAPFTEYQETACRSARKIGCPVLDINQAIVEIIALGHTACAIKLREIIDTNYAEYLVNSESHREILAEQRLKAIAGDQSPTTKESVAASDAKTKEEASVNTPKSAKSVKSGKSTASKIVEKPSEKPAMIQLYVEPDPLDEFNKIPPPEEFENKDPLDEYDYKVRSILLMQKILAMSTGVKDKSAKGTGAKDKGSAKSTKKGSVEDTFLGISSDLICEALRQRLSMTDFEAGFVLQTLSNVFVNDETNTLLMLLRIVGNIKYFMFVTFYNSMKLYCVQNDKLIADQETIKLTTAMDKLHMIDEMLQDEYDNLDEEDKKLYAEKVLVTRKEASAQRKEIYMRRVTEAKHRRRISKETRNKKGLKGNRSKILHGMSQPRLKASDIEVKEQSAKSKSKERGKGSSRKGTNSKEDTKKKSEPLSKSLQMINVQMDAYLASLAALQPILTNWDPMRGQFAEPAGKGKTPKTAKGKDKSAEPKVVEENKGFYVWYAIAKNFQEPDIYDWIVSEMEQNDLAKSALPVKIVEKPNLEPKLYSVVFQKPFQSTPSVPQDVAPMPPDFINVIEFSGKFVVPKKKRYRMADHDILKNLTLTNCPVLFFPILYNVKISTNEVFTLLSVLEILPGEIDSMHNSVTNEQMETENQIVKKDRSKESSPVLSATQSHSTSSPVSVIEVDEPLKPRWVMEPHVVQKFKVRFTPQRVGAYKQEFRLIIVGSNYTYYIIVDGTADIPRLNMDPSVIFTRVAETRTDDSNLCTFFIDTETYDFGPLLLLKTKDKRTHRAETIFNFANISTMYAEVFFFQMENNDAFDIQPDSLYIAPGEVDTLNLSAGVSKLGPNVDRLLLCVKDNPQVEIIRLQSTGCKLEIELEGKIVMFDKILLYRKEMRTVNIRNDSNVQTYWNLEPLQNMDPQITYSPRDGYSKPFTENHIEFNYCAKTVGVIEKNTIAFKMFLDETDTEPLITDLITVTGETYDVLVDVAYANPLDLGCIKVGSATSQVFTIKNRGLYEIKYIIQMEQPAKLMKLNSNLRAELREDFTIHPSTGSLMPDKSMTVNVTYIPKNEITITEAPLLKCHLVDTNKTIAAVAEFPLTVSVVSYYARFKIDPSRDVNFGACGIYTKKIMFLNIENIGNFPFQYSVKPPMTTVNETASIKKDKKDKEKKTPETNDTMSKKDKKSPKTAKTPKAVEVPGLKVGPFMFVKFSGTVEVGETEAVAIECYPEAVGLFEEEIIVMVPDSVPEKIDGTQITLIVNACLPQIDFSDLIGIFQENFIVEYIQDFVGAKELGGHTIFVLHEKCLYFRRVGVLTTHTAYFKLSNPGLVFADVAIVFQADKATPTTNKPDTFVIQPQRETIPALSSKMYTVSFTPTLIETYTAVFDIIVELPPSFKSPRLTIKLSGEGCVPEVALIEPSIRDKHGATIMNFGRTLLGEVGCKTLSLKNVGSIKAKVIIEVYKDFNLLFALEAQEDTKKTINIWDCDVPNDRNTVCHLIPEEVGQFNVKFTPNEVGKAEGQVRLFIVDNPYENIAVVLQGEGYVETVVFEGLELTEPVINFGSRTSNTESFQKSRRSTKTSTKSVSPSIGTLESASSVISYKLDYGSCFLNKMKRISFKITNRSSDQYFRFEWTAHPNVVFTPSIGHLKEYGSKDITATFLASEPMEHTQTILESSVCEINFFGLPDEMFWDDRQSNVRWDEAKPNIENGQDSKDPVLKKIVEPVREPDHEIIPGTMKSIQLLLSVVAAYSEYKCSVQQINFKDTLMFQACEYMFELTNPGTVNLEYAWSLNMDEQFPVRLSNTALQAVLKSLENPNTCSRPSSRASNNTLYPRDHRPSCKPIPSSERVIEIRPDICQGTKSDLFSSTAALTNRSTDSWVEGDYLPFKVIPESGILIPGETANCTLKFSPLDVFDYQAHLICKMENLNPESPPLNIIVTARSLLPYCHFDVPESDYLSSGKRDPKLPGPLGNEYGCPLPDNTRVIEFKVIGVGQTHVKKFIMINPTAEDYYFSWHDNNVQSTEEVSRFHCMVMEGVAERGKQTELAFTFLAQDVGTFESFWIFAIEKYELETLFLFVGTVTEPSVYYLTVHLKMKPTLMGMKVSDSITIVNNESFQLPFRILPDSLYSEGRLQCLIVEPMSGILQPQSEQLLRIAFQPAFPGESEFSVQCRVKKMKNPLITFVTTMAFSIKPSISYNDKDGYNVIQIEHDKDNIIDFGNVIPKKPVTLKIYITNMGKTTFYYNWDLKMDPDMVAKNYYAVTMQQKQGHVTSQSRSTCYLTLTAFRKAQIRNHPVTIKINRGPEYHLLVKAMAQKPSYVFEFTVHDFGPSYIQGNTTGYYGKAIHFTNYEDTPCILECTFENVPHLMVCCEHLSAAVPACSSTKIPVHFRPLERKCYREVIMFTINTTIEYKITYLGEGIPYKVCLVNPKHKSVNLGHLPLGKSLSKKIPIVNKGRAPIQVTIGIMSDLPGYEEHHYQLQPCSFENATRKHSGQSSTQLDRPKIGSKILGSSKQGVLTILPSGDVNLLPNKSIDIVVTFTPTQRLRMLTEKIAVQMHTTILPLSIVKGSCIAAEFLLNRTYLPFGTVIEGCLSEIKLILTNTGDVGAKFKWNITKMQPNFDLAPLAGYCSPGMDITFMVTFHPVQLSNMIKGEATVEIENYQTLTVAVTGGCCKLPDPTDTIYFTTQVRKSITKDLSITNNTNQPWQLEPIITGDHFSTHQIFTALPKQANICVVTYRPLVMTSEEIPHKATVFFKLPEGKGLLYTLIGVSNPPEALGKIVREFPAKTKYTELLPVFNWLNKRQRFACEIELTNEVKGNPIYTFTGNKALDIPPDTQRDYRAIFHCYKDASFNFKVIFINDEGEYNYYELQYKVTKPEIQESIKMVTTIRSPVCHLLELQNPLTEQQITYTANCPNPNITIYGFPKTVKPESNDRVRIEFYPMVPFETVVKLDVTCPELGAFPYELRLKANPTSPEKPTHVTAVLGSSTTFAIVITNCSKKNTDFLLKTDNPSLTCDKFISIVGFKEGTTNLVYEPCDVENVTATLTVSSEIAGEYIFPIIGTFTMPKPQGPYTIKPGTVATIPFKNVFKDIKSFNISVDVPTAFYTKNSVETIKSKKSVNIIVSLRNVRSMENIFENNFPVTGKLIVSCNDAELSHVKWIYYLRGVLE